MHKVLVVYASRMGSTGEIAVEIGKRLTTRGFAVDVRPTSEALDARLYDAVVLGSPVYMRRWDKDAIHYLEDHAPDLSERPTWLFQSGPCGHEDFTQHSGTPHAVEKICFEIGIEPAKTFGGNLDPNRAHGWLEKKMASGELSGDFRDWDEIRAWADSIAEALNTPRSVSVV